MQVYVAEFWLQNIKKHVSYEKSLHTSGTPFVVRNDASNEVMRGDIHDILMGKQQAVCFISFIKGYITVVHHQHCVYTYSYVINWDAGSKYIHLQTTPWSKSYVHYIQTDGDIGATSKRRLILSELVTMLLPVYLSNWQRGGSGADSSMLFYHVNHVCNNSMDPGETPSNSASKQASD